MTTDTHDRDPFERRISSLMEAASQDLVPGPSFPVRLKRRARMQQATLIVGGLAMVIVVAVFAGAAVRALLPGPSSVAPATSEEERGSGGSFPCTVEPQPYQPKDVACVATGTYDDATWTLVTYEDKKNGTCIDIEVTTPDGGGGGGGCGYQDDRGIGIGISSGDEYPDGIAYGPVTPSVDRLVLERDNGDEIELELYPTPGYSPPDTFPSFYLVFLPEDAGALVAYDETGTEIDRRDDELDPAPPVPESTQLGPPVQVASGTYEGLAWDLQAYEERMGDDVRPCTELHLGKGEERFGGGGGCYLLPDQVIGYSESAYGKDYPSLISIAGAVRPEVNEITLELADGSSIPLAIYRMSVDGDTNEQFDVDFFVGFIDVGKRGTLEGHVVAHAENGDVLERHRLCPDFKAGSDSTCGGG